MPPSIVILLWATNETVHQSESLRRSTLVTTIYHHHHHYYHYYHHQYQREREKEREKGVWKGRRETEGRKWDFLSTILGSIAHVNNAVWIIALVCDGNWEWQPAQNCERATQTFNSAMLETTLSLRWDFGDSLAASDTALVIPRRVLFLSASFLVADFWESLSVLCESPASPASSALTQRMYWTQ